jgi:hypothetical protein
VRHLASAKALKQLDLSGTKVTTEGTMGLESIPTLETLRSFGNVCHGRAASGIGEGVEAPQPQRTKVTTEGTMGLESIPTLEELDLSSTPITTCGIWHRRRS